MLDHIIYIFKNCKFKIFTCIALIACMCSIFIFSTNNKVYAASVNDYELDNEPLTANLLDYRYLCNGTTAEDGSPVDLMVQKTRVITNYLPIISDTTYTLSVNDSFLVIYEINYFNSAYESIQTNFSLSTKQITFTTPSNASYLVLSFRHVDNIGISVDSVKECTMLNYGSNALEYQPYMTTELIYNESKKEVLDTYSSYVPMEFIRLRVEDNDISNTNHSDFSCELSPVDIIDEIDECLQLENGIFNLNQLDYIISTYYKDTLLYQVYNNDFEFYLDFYIDLSDYAYNEDLLYFNYYGDLYKWGTIDSNGLLSSYYEAPEFSGGVHTLAVNPSVNSFVAITMTMNKDNIKGGNWFSISRHQSNGIYNYGYGQGYNEGVLQGIEQGKEQGNQAFYEDGFVSGFEEGKASGYDKGYAVGYDDALEISGDINSLPKTFLNALFSTPINLLKSLLNWDFFGINLFSVLTSLLTIAVVVFLFRKFKK